MPGAIAVEIGGQSVLSGITIGALSAASALFSVLRAVLARMSKAILKLTITIAKDAAFVPVSAGRRQ